MGIVGRVLNGANALKEVLWDKAGGALVESRARDYERVIAVNSELEKELRKKEQEIEELGIELNNRRIEQASEMNKSTLLGISSQNFEKLKQQQEEFNQVYEKYLEAQKQAEILRNKRELCQNKRQAARAGLNDLQTRSKSNLEVLNNIYLKKASIVERNYPGTGKIIDSAVDLSQDLALWQSRIEKGDKQSHETIDKERRNMDKKNKYSDNLTILSELCREEDGLSLGDILSGIKDVFGYLGTSFKSMKYNYDLKTAKYTKTAWESLSSELVSRQTDIFADKMRYTNPEIKKYPLEFDISVGMTRHWIDRIYDKLFQNDEDIFKLRKMNEQVVKANKESFGEVTGDVEAEASSLAFVRRMGIQEIPEGMDKDTALKNRVENISKLVSTLNSGDVVINPSISAEPQLSESQEVVTEDPVRRARFYKVKAVKTVVDIFTSKGITLDKLDTKGREWVDNFLRQKGVGRITDDEWKRYKEKALEEPNYNGQTVDYRYQQKAVTLVCQKLEESGLDEEQIVKVGLRYVNDFLISKNVSKITQSEFINMYNKVKNR